MDRQTDRQTGGVQRLLRSPMEGRVIIEYSGAARNSWRFHKQLILYSFNLYVWSSDTLCLRERMPLLYWY